MLRNMEIIDSALLVVVKALLMCCLCMFIEDFTSRNEVWLSQ